MIIELTKKDLHFQEIYFCASIIAKTPDYEMDFKKLLKVKDGEMISTDGKRLHVADMHLEDGYYKICQCKKTKVQLFKTDDEIEFPDTDDIINANKDSYKLLNGGDKDCVYSICTDISRALHENNALNFNFIKDCLDIDTFNPMVSPEEGEPIILKNHNKTAYIMPMKR